MSGPLPWLLRKKSMALYWLAVFFLGLLLTPGFNSFETPHIESIHSFVMTKHLGLDRAPSDLYSRGPDGLYYPVHEVGTLFVSIPFAAMSRLVSERSGFPFVDVFWLTMGFVSAACLATTFVTLLGTARANGFQGDGKIPVHLLLLLLSSQYLVYALYPADVSLSATLLTVTFFAWSQADTKPDSFYRWMLTGAACSGLILLKLTNVPVLVVVVVLALTTRGLPGSLRWRNATALTAGYLPGLLLTGWWNQLRTGSAFSTPYPAVVRLDARYIFEGLVGTLFSPGKGLFVFSPILLLIPTAWRSLWADAWGRRALMFVLGSFVIAFGRIAAQPAWDGYGGWGIRYYTPWIPLLLLLVSARSSSDSRWKRRLFLGLVVVGMALNLSAVVTNYHYRQSLCGFSPWSVMGANVCALVAAPANLARAVGLPLPELVVAGASERNVFVSNRIATWWFAIRVAGVPPAASWAVGLLIMLLAVSAWKAARRADRAALQPARAAFGTDSAGRHFP